MKIEVIIFTIIIVLIIYYYVIKNSNENNFNNSNNSNNSNNDIKLYNKLKDYINNAINQYSLVIDKYMIIACIKKESSYEALTKENKNVTGDKGKSIGFMQVTEIALLDVNRYYKTSFTKELLYNEKFNIIVGSLYLNICYLSAVKEKAKNIVKVAFKKYNGGIDETETSMNSKAELYSEQAYKYYLELKKIL